MLDKFHLLLLLLLLLLPEAQVVWGDALQPRGRRRSWEVFLALRRSHSTRRRRRRRLPNEVRNGSARDGRRGEEGNLENALRTLLSVMSSLRDAQEIGRE